MEKQKFTLEQVRHISKWLTSFHADDVKGTLVLTYNKAHSIRNTVYRFNNYKADCNLFFHVARVFYDEYIIIIVVCETRETYLKNYENGTQDEWVEKIPQPYRDRYNKNRKRQW